MTLTFHGSVILSGVSPFACERADEVEGPLPQEKGALRALRKEQTKDEVADIPYGKGSKELLQFADRQLYSVKAARKAPVVPAA